MKRKEIIVYVLGYIFQFAEIFFYVGALVHVFAFFLNYVIPIGIPMDLTIATAMAGFVYTVVLISKLVDDLAQVKTMIVIWGKMSADKISLEMQQMQEEEKKRRQYYG